MGTQGPGDVWDWSISNGKFDATNETTGFTYSGTESMLPTGFMKLTVQATSDPIVACSLGSNPPGPTVDFNYVNVPKQGWTTERPHVWVQVQEWLLVEQWSHSATFPLSWSVSL